METKYGYETMSNIEGWKGKTERGLRE